jgi:hypothetical protein
MLADRGGIACIWLIMSKAVDIEISIRVFTMKAVIHGCMALSTLSAPCQPSETNLESETVEIKTLHGHHSDYEGVRHRALVGEKRTHFTCTL